jgi:hypothetical protein
MSTDITKMSAAELKAALKKKQADETAAAKAKRKAYDTLRDEFIASVFSKFEAVQAELGAFKAEAVKLGLELHDKMYEAYGREKREGIDHYTLTSDDGTKKVVIQRDWLCRYDETVEVGIGMIKEVVRDKFEPRNKGMYAVIDGLLLKGNEGDYDERMVAKLRKHADAFDNDPRFFEALDIITRAYKPVESRLYLRVYRKTEAGAWEDISVNWSRM